MATSTSVALYCGTRYCFNGKTGGPVDEGLLLKVNEQYGCTVGRKERF